MSAKYEKTHETASEIISEPVVQRFEEITGLQTCISQLEAFTKNLNEAVAISSDSEQKVLDMKVELNSAKDSAVVRALLALVPDSEQKLADSLTKSNRTAVNTAIQQIKAQQVIISQHTSNLMAKYGNPEVAPSVHQKKGTKSHNGEINPSSLINQGFLDSIPADWKITHELSVEPVPDTEFFRAYFNGSNTGTIYKSNITKLL